MNQLTIIGNVTRTPETAATPSGKRVCNFNVAVNRRSGGQDTVDYFRVTAWEPLGDNCARYLDKGRKVAVRGPVTARAYIANDGTPRASLEMTAQEVEFLTPSASALPDPAESAYQQQERQAIQQEARQQGFTQVSSDELPF